MNDKCPACGEGQLEIVIEDHTSFGTRYHNQMHGRCDSCGFECVNGTMMKHNNAQPKTEIEGPYKPIVVTDLISSSAYFNWSWQGVGFGQLSFHLDKETGKIHCMNECMGPGSVRKLLHAYVDKLMDDMILEDK